VVAFSSGNKVVVLGVVERKLVKLGTVDKPAKYGPLVAHPIDRREELWFVDKPAGVHYRLTNHDALLAAAAPKKKK
jgi:hypothetical protein